MSSGTFQLPRDDRPWGTVRGNVRAGKPGGPPIAGALMTVAQIGSYLDAHGDADDHGRFEVPCVDGKAVVYARDPEGDLAGYAVVDKVDDREFTIVAGPAATARGRVVDESGKPWASVNVTYTVVVAFDGADTKEAYARQVVLTDDDGRFTAPGLPVGTRCYFSAQAPGASNVPSRRIEVKDARPFEIPPLVIDRPRPRPPVPR